MDNQMIKETDIALAAAWPGVKSIGHDLVLVDNIGAVPVPADARRMNFILIVLCTKGSLKYYLNTHPVEVKTGDMLIVTERHVVDCYEPSPDVEGLAFLMTPDFFHEVINNISDLTQVLLYSRNHPLFNLDASSRKTFSDYFNVIKDRVANSTNRYRRELVRSLMLALLYDLSDVVYRSQQEAVPEHRLKRGEIIFTKFIKLVEQHCRSERRVGWYALQLDITPKYLSELVKAVSRKTPNEWIDNYVLTEVRVMLKTTTKPIKVITQELNFPNQSFLGKFFKEHMGMSPSKYRRLG